MQRQRKMWVSGSKPPAWKTASLINVRNCVLMTR